MKASIMLGYNVGGGCLKRKLYKSLKEVNFGHTILCHDGIQVLFIENISYVILRLHVTTLLYLSFWHWVF